MRKIAFLLALCLCCFTGCGVDKKGNVSEQKDGVEIYRALPLPDLYLEIPASFAKTSSEMYEEYYIKDDASIIVTQDTAGAPYTSVKDYTVYALAQYQSLASELELLHEEVLYAGKTAVHTLEFTYTVELGEDIPPISMTCLIGYLTDTNNMYIITCKSNVDTYELYRDDFRQTVQSASFVQ